MAKVEIDEYVPKIEKVLADFAKLLASWKTIAADAKGAGVKAELNKLKTAYWNLENAYKMFEAVDDETGTITRQTEKARERGAAKHAAMPIRKKKGS
jgi:hypothetical protein